jgi:hypothetical protein
MNEENLRPFHTLSESEQRKIRSKGGIASGKARKAKKTMKQMLDYLLEKDIKTNKGDMSTLEAIMVSMIAKASKGDVRATEFIRDTIGQKPSDKVVGELSIKQALVEFGDGKSEGDNSAAVQTSTD